MGRVREFGKSDLLVGNKTMGRFVSCSTGVTGGALAIFRPLRAPQTLIGGEQEYIDFVLRINASLTSLV